MKQTKKKNTIENELQSISGINEKENENNHLKNSMNNQPLPSIEEKEQLKDSEIAPPEEQKVSNESTSDIFESNPKNSHNDSPKADQDESQGIKSSIEAIEIKSPKEAHEVISSDSNSGNEIAIDETGDNDI